MRRSWALVEWVLSILVAGVAMQAGAVQAAGEGWGRTGKGETVDTSEDLVRYVDPFIGTGPSNSPDPVPGGAGGSTIPGPLAPFGMVQFSPDTDHASPSGYGYRGTEIQGFSLTHFNGAGCPNNEDIPLLPVIGPLRESPGSSWGSYAVPFSHDRESASAGYYRVRLDSGVEVELTATTRTGMARITFPPSSDGKLLINCSRNATGERTGSLRIDGQHLVGTFTSGGFCGSATTVPMYFAIELNRAPAGVGTWLHDVMSPGSTRVEGVRSGGWVRFDTSVERTVMMKIGLSYTSLANARLNLETENPGWSFDEVRAGTAKAWNDVLRRVRITGGSDADRVELYTALYHVFSNPNVWNDVNGEYRGFDGALHTANGWTNYQNYSGWDIIRSWTHLMGLVAPEVSDITRSMVEGGGESGLLPFWTDRNVETMVMVGDPGTVNVSNAYAMGVRGFDTEKALALMLKSANDPEHTQRWGLEDWIEKHYCAGNAAITLEYALADFTIAQYAQALGRPDLARQFLKRSAYWKESWNPTDGYVEPRGGSGDEAARIYEVQVFGPGGAKENFALGRPATASSSCNDRETPDKAVNGTWDGGLGDKWCDNESEHKWWRVDLGERRTLGRFEIYHAQMGGESSAWNTRDFKIQGSDDDATWTDLVTVRGNRDSLTVHEIAPIKARYVRLDLTPAEADTGWGCQPFDRASGCGFVEGNAAQYVWMVPHDLEGLFQLMGGRATAVTRLDDLFQELNAGIGRPYFYIGNEPEHGTPWIYNFAQAPAKTQAVVRRIVDQEFLPDPGGLPGNDDLGATSAWLTWAYLGMFPAIPGTDIMVLHGPYFPRAQVTLANGNVLTIEGEGAGPNAPYVQSLTIDGKDTTKSWLRYADIAHGATLHFVMGGTPSPSWGRGAGDVPPSFPAR